MQSVDPTDPVPLFTKAKTTSYVQTLNKLGIDSALEYPWAKVGLVERTQGWKIHISSINVEAERLLSVVTRFLHDAGLSFKIAATSRILSSLNEGLLGPTQVGKFMTIYPAKDEVTGHLARVLVQLTENFHGPVVVTDMRLGRVVYARYGGFNPEIHHDRLGRPFPAIRRPNGIYHPDAYSIPFVCPTGVANPFTILAKKIEPNLKLLGPGYLLIGVAKASAKGSVFRAIDLRSRDLVSRRIIKQGRAYCLSDDLGRDIRSRLKRQGAIHNILLSRGIDFVPSADAYFESDCDGYLPLEYIPGNDFGKVLGTSWSSKPQPERDSLLNRLMLIVKNTRELHREGFVHRDLTPTNLWLGRNGRTYFLDLELSYEVGEAFEPFSGGTPGFMSPQQEAGKPPAFADDVYAIGCILAFVFTGINPEYLLTNKDKIQSRRLARLIGSEELGSIVIRCTRHNPDSRPSLLEIEDVLQSAIAG